MSAFDEYRRGEPLPVLQGKVDEAGFDYYRRGEVALAIIITPASGVAATVTATLPKLSAAAVGAERVPATVGATLPALRASLGATESVPAAVTAGLPKLAAAATGTETVRATIGATLPKLSAAILGQYAVIQIGLAAQMRITSVPVGMTVVSVSDVPIVAFMADAPVIERARAIW